MRVAIIHTDFRIYWPARIYTLQQTLHKNNIELYVVEIAGKGSPYSFSKKETNYPIDNWNILFPESKMEDLSMSIVKRSVLKMLDEINPDIVIAGAIAFPSGAVSTLWCKKNRKKIIIFDDAKVDDIKRNGLVNFIKKRIYRNVDAILYPAREWDETGFYWGFNKEQIFYGIDVVDNDFWRNVKSYNNYNIKDCFFLSIGRLVPKKNFLFLLEAYKKYQDSVREDKAFDLIIIGDGPDKSLLEDYISENKLEKVLLLPFLQQNELAYFYRNSKSFILSSKQDETWGLVINEALACGCPVLASENCGATKSLIENGINGYIFNPYNVNDLVEKMLTIHSMDKNNWEKLSANALLKINEYSTELFANSLLDAIKYVTKRSLIRLSLLDNFILNFWKGRYRPI